MACAACSLNKKGEGYITPQAGSFPPLQSNDIYVLDNGETRLFNQGDWPSEMHKLILFFPEVNTPVCSTEMGVLHEWVPKFRELGVEVYAATTDNIGAVKEWYESNDELSSYNYKVMSTFLLPSRLKILNNGRAKRASVFITRENDLIIQEHFLKVGRSIEELYRTYHAYTTGSYCAEGWKSELDGFLDK